MKTGVEQKTPLRRNFETEANEWLDKHVIKKTDKTKKSDKEEMKKRRGEE